VVGRRLASYTVTAAAEGRRQTGSLVVLFSPFSLFLQRIYSQGRNARLAHGKFAARRITPHVRL
jgi:hypothetical protein